MSKFFEALERAERDRVMGARPMPSTTLAEERAEGEFEGEPVRRGRVVTCATQVVPAEVPDSAWGPVLRSAIEVAPPPEDEVDDHLVSLVAPNSREAEQYRAIRYFVEELRRTAELNVLAVSSPSDEEGKTLTAINLAGALSQALEVRVLLVEADLRRPSVARYLGLGRESRPGLVDVVASTARGTLDQAVHSLPRFNLDVVLAGRPSTTPYEVLKSAALGELMTEARRRYDFVIVDTPPLVGLPDSRVIAAWVDGFAVVITAHRTPRRQIDEALATIDADKLVGIVFNRDDARTIRYRPYGRSVSPDRGSAWSRVWRRS
jgi:capsular exopolysaccharide synthesis family protein